MPETAPCSSGPRRFVDLRGVQWRIDLGILPSSLSATVDDLRQVTANSRRRYASLRRKLLVDPHILKDGSNSPDLVMDNPLSQNPDSMWGRFFKNAELERILDTDLTRLYPERGSYFQTNACQGILRRILLLWCLSHPEYGYGQGMHELLAPLLYVLHIDVERLVEVRKLYEDHFAENFDEFSFHENDFTYKFDFKKLSEFEDDKIRCKSSTKIVNHSEIDPAIRTIVLLSDAYGAEGELGVVLSEKFMEHDAYSMFDALMGGTGGAVAMTEFFSPRFVNCLSGFPPVIEASAALYHLLSIVDSSLHSHLVELGVEPQYFALRWLRVLFGREFSLEDLLVIWDEVLSHENTNKSSKASGSETESNFRVLDSPRGAFISAFAVSMILNLRSALLATENATVCLKRLLNFPEEVNIVKLIGKATSLQALAIEVNTNCQQTQHLLYSGRKSAVGRGHSLSLDLTSPGTPLNMVHESYWEEKWRVLHKEEESRKDGPEKPVISRKKGWSDRVRLRLSRTESDPSPSMKHEILEDSKPVVRRNLLEDLTRQLGSEDKVSLKSDEDIGHPLLLESNGQYHTDEKLNNEVEVDGVGSEKNSSNFSEPQSVIRGNDIDLQENDLESSVASNSSIYENYEISDSGFCGINLNCSPLPASDRPIGNPSRFTEDGDSIENSVACTKQTKLLSGKFQWLWKFGRHAREGTSNRAGVPDEAKTTAVGGNDHKKDVLSTDDGCDRLCSSSHGDTVDQNVMYSLKILGQSMLENIQVIESVFQEDNSGSSVDLKKNFSEEGKVTAMAALDELRRISDLLSDM